jgi:hypothetical protein
MFVEEAKNRLSQDDPRSSQGDQRLHEDDPGLYQDQQDQSLSRPMARAFQKLTDLKNAASMAISLLANIDTEECYGNIFSENFDKNHCSNCRNGICNILKMPNLKEFLQKFYVGLICSTDFFDAATKDNFSLNFELLLKETKNKVQLRVDAAAEDNLIKKDADPQTVKLLLKETKNYVHSRADLLNVKSLLTETQNNVISKVDQEKQNQAEITTIKEEL